MVAPAALTIDRHIPNGDATVHDRVGAMMLDSGIALRIGVNEALDSLAPLAIGIKVTDEHEPRASSLAPRGKMIEHITQPVLAIRVESEKRCAAVTQGHPKRDMPAFAPIIGRVKLLDIDGPAGHNRLEEGVDDGLPFSLLSNKM